MPIQDEIRQLAGRYATGQMSIDDLDRWLTPNLDRVEASEDPEAERLAMTILGYLADCGDGLMSEAEVRERVRSLLSTRVYSQDFSNGELRPWCSSLTAASSVRDFTFKVE